MFDSMMQSNNSTLGSSPSTTYETVMPRARNLEPRVRITFRYRRSIDQKLRARDNYFISWFYAVEHHIIVVHDLANLQRLLVRHQFAVLLFGDKQKVLAADPGYGNKRDSRPVLRSPNHARAKELRVPQLVLIVSDGRLRQNRLCRVIHLRRNETDTGICQHVARAIHNLHGSVHPQLCGLFDRHVDIRFQAARLIHRGEHRRGDHTIPDADRNITDNSIPRRDHLVVVKLDLLLVYLRFERTELRLCGFQRGLCLVKLLLAAHPRLVQFADSVILHLCPLHIRELSGVGIFLTLYRRLLLPGIDLHQRRSRRDVLARAHIDIDDVTLNLRHDCCGITRLERRNVLGCILDRNRLRDLHLHRNRGGSLCLLAFGVASAAGNHDCAEHQDGSQSREQIGTQSHTPARPEFYYDHCPVRRQTMIVSEQCTSRKVYDVCRLLHCSIMKPARSFASDNNAGIHPDVLKAISAANQGHAVGYGDDPFTESALEKFKQHFGDDIETFIVFNGTAANCLSLKALTDSYHAVICTEAAHIYTDECGAPER